jgi:hypothetical protein
MSDKTILDYYTHHSPITDPGPYAAMLADLPSDLPALVEMVQGLLYHFAWQKSYGVTLPKARHQEMHLRTMPDMLERLLGMNDAPLTVTRPPEQRLVSLCRDFAVFLVSMLRQQGIPARLRIGFAGYFPAERPRYWDHRIAEYWDAPQGRWVLADPQLDAYQQRICNITFDPLDIPDDGSFYVAGRVWQLCRAGQADPMDFGDSPTDLGLPPIRYALLHDFDALNKVELVGTDTWHELIDKPEADLTDADRTLLDELAAVTVNVDQRFGDLQALYNTTPYGLAVQKALDQLPVLKQPTRH